MKDYKFLVVWTDYFNSNFSRSEGRRVPINSCVKNPTLEELVKAATRLGYKPIAVEASFPKRSSIHSGYINIERKKSKSVILKEISKSLGIIKGEGN